MTRTAIPRALAVLLLATGCSLVQADVHFSEAAGRPDGAEPVLELQLADGSVVRVPSDAIDKRADGQGQAERGSATRRTVPRPRVHVFDALRPGAVASVRG